MLAYGFPNLTCQSQDLQENVAWVPEVDVMAGWGLCHIPTKMVILLLLDLVQFCNWQVPGLSICPNLWGPFHKVSSVLASNTCGKLPIHHYSGDGMEQRKFYQFPAVAGFSP